MSKPCFEHTEREGASFCVACGKSMCEECVVKHGGRTMCADCVGQLSYERKPVESKPIKEISQTVKKQAPVKKQAAVKKKALPPKKVFADTGEWKTPENPVERKPGFLDVAFGREPRRVVARLIDFCIITLLAMPLSFGLSIITASMFSEVRGFGYDLCFYIMLIIVSSFYFIIGEWRFGKTPGKLILKLEVVRKDGTPGLGFFQCSWRWTGFLAGVLWSLIGWWIGSHVTGIFIFMLKKTGVSVPQFLPVLVLFVSIAIFVMFSLGLLITFIGKYKRGFHDILGGTAVVWNKK